MERFNRCSLLVCALLFAACGSPQASPGASVPKAPDREDAARNSPEQNKDIARQLIRSDYPQWKTEAQFQCLDKLWYAESHWDHRAVNKRSGACGIPQSYPCRKMADWGKTYGLSYRRNPWPQIAWGLQYIDKRYGTPCKAWNRFKKGGGY